MSIDISQRYSLTSFIEQSARSARELAARYLPGSVKKRLKAGPLRILTDAMDRMEAWVFSRSLSQSMVQPSVECREASASMSIVVAIHDAPLVTMRCLASLERDATKSEVILVDDGSRMVETRQLIDEFSSRNGWKVVRNREPGGHSAASAAGARLATRPYLCLLNSDTVVTPGCWRAIQQAFETDLSIGVAGPSTSSSGNEQTLDIAIKCRSYWDDVQICAFAEQLDAAALGPAIVDSPWISGFAFFIRRSLWERLDGFDPKVPGYLNDIELCMRVAKADYRTVWVRNAYIHHLGNQSYRKTLPDREIEGIMQARVQYIRNKHNWEPPVNAAYTRVVRGRDGRTWTLSSATG